jgi:dehydrogenase/reductase SDR family protein 12
LANNARVINVLSGGMYSQAVDVDDLENQQGIYSGSAAYAKAKRGLMIVTEQWAKLWQADGISVHAMHPGWADTAGVVDSLPEFYKLTKPILRTPQQGADTIVWLASATEVSQTTGLFWLDREPRPTHLTVKNSRDTATTRAVMAVPIKLSAAIFK